MKWLRFRRHRHQWSASERWERIGAKHCRLYRTCETCGEKQTTIVGEMTWYCPSWRLPHDSWLRQL